MININIDWDQSWIFNKWSLQVKKKKDKFISKCWEMQCFFQTWCFPQKYFSTLLAFLNDLLVAFIPDILKSTDTSYVYIHSIIIVNISIIYRFLT